MSQEAWLLWHKNYENITKKILIPMILMLSTCQLVLYILYHAALFMVFKELLQ